MNEFTSIVQKILRVDDTCRYAAEVKETTQGKNRPRCLAVIGNRSFPDETAIFVLKKTLVTWRVDYVIPLYSDIKLNTNSLALEIKYENPAQLYSFEAQSQESASGLVAEVNKAVQRSQPHKDAATDDAFQWTEFYTQDQAGDSPIQTQQFSHLDLQGSGTVSPGQRSARVSDVNEAWIHTQLRSRETEFTRSLNVSIFLGTWNVNGRKPSESLEPWLRDPSLQPDIYAVGFQELDLSAEALLMGDTKAAAPWEQAIISTLMLQGDYVCLMTKQLVGIFLCVYVKKEHVPYIPVADVQVGIAAVGIMGMMGNKGGVAIRLKFYDSTICVVNSHLNAHFENVQRRNQDMKDIARRIVFYNEQGEPFTMNDHDHLFWIGDLNYRLTLPDAEVKDKIKKSEWAALFSSDQLMQQMKAGAAFENFQEGQILFAPTYKYDNGTNTYDSSEKKRTPAWCDRVLWRKNNKTQDNVTLLSYRRHELLSSDHRPVSATFMLKVKSVIQETRSRIYQDLVKELDRKENDCMPDATVSVNSVEFSNIRYMIPSTHVVTIENTGQVAARFRFIPKPDDNKFCKPWLWISPPFGVIVPHEKISINITVSVDNSTADALNTGKDQLEDILILHLENGKDFFITVSGSYLPTCFGSSLDYLVKYPNPVRSATPATASDQKLSIPKELWRLVDYIYKRGLSEEGLFLQSGVQKEMEQIRECLDTGENFASYNVGVHSMTETVVRFLESLAEPVIPFSSYNQVLEASSSYSSCRVIVASLPTVHYNVFYYIIAFLREMLSYPENKVTPDKLAVLFSSVLIRSLNPKLNAENIKKKANFIFHFLVDDEDLKVN